mmetsp:Transcript_38959/g.71976  ORF Transcript_38959/g.71976 Transcript_38959/m.71976 type:complete len:252 (-) Transcript_38959:96-851(-)|eukprot:CAMPEP_0197458660 /NCGR_PEP_ID=MMETSP1175-20131217/49294_1 /TAXON_ID=1003142 /ORGANISM="Triceratium dubium, Strain CCMP147" /LENGTH=251 /DNA_ID=CAMNT_0042993353 /DNA_START=163 /DNA_END=918 /DNA_ORIENTATION=+
MLSTLQSTKLPVHNKKPARRSALVPIQVEGSFQSGILKVETLDESLRSIEGGGMSAESLVDLQAKACERGAVHRRLFSTNEKTLQKITFSTVEIRGYKTILGDNPSVSSGPPLSIGWDVVSTVKVHVDVYETCRPNRRQETLLAVSTMEREERLMRAGYSRAALDEAVKQIRRQKNFRMETRQNLYRHGEEEFIEVAAAKPRKLLYRPYQKLLASGIDEEDKLWKMAQRPQDRNVGNRISGRIMKKIAKAA